MEYSVQIREVKTSGRFIKVEADSQKEAEELVAEGISNLGFDEIGIETDFESEISVNSKWLEDDSSLTDM